METIEHMNKQYLLDMTGSMGIEQYSIGTQKKYSMCGIISAIFKYSTTYKHMGLCVDCV